MIGSLGTPARYAAFACVATALNLTAQWLSFRFYDGPYAFGVALAAGTGAGLVVKYFLDKRWIFFDNETGVAAHSRKFIFYSLFGVATTSIFWGTEIVCNRLSDAASVKFLGGAVGLSIGYWTKYRLDRRFVFRRSTACIP
jgi:putative flippase GtrA